MFNIIVPLILSLIIYSCTPLAIDNKASQKVIAENNEKKTYTDETSNKEISYDDNNIVSDNDLKEVTEKINNIIHIRAENNMDLL